MNNLPLEIVKHILQYDERFVIRYGKIIQINKIKKDDERYNILLKLPKKVKNLAFLNSISLILPINECNFFLITYYNYEITITKIHNKKKYFFDYPDIFVNYTIYSYKMIIS